MKLIRVGQSGEKKMRLSQIPLPQNSLKFPVVPKGTWSGGSDCGNPFVMLQMHPYLRHPFSPGKGT